MSKNRNADCLGCLNPTQSALLVCNLNITSANVTVEDVTLLKEEFLPAS